MDEELEAELYEQDRYITPEAVTPPLPVDEEDEEDSEDYWDQEREDRKQVMQVVMERHPDMVITGEEYNDFIDNG